ncbi:MAG: SDR family oxidoreductase [Polyangiales bacterium]|nr:SDR family oxidoreductase [Sandaracinaceae bacterium]
MLRDKVIVITGAARGVGLACASRFASQGALLLLNDVGCDVTGHGAAPGLMEEVAAQLRARGAQVESDGRDITEQGVPEALCELAAARFGRLDGVVSCAGVVERARFGRTSDAARARAFAVSVEAPLALTRAAHRHMARSGGGSVALLGGTAGLNGQRRELASAMAHGALVAMVRTAALELRSDRVRVNAVIPTALTRQTEDLPLFQSGHAKLAPEHVAPLVAHLMSDAASEVSGQVVGVAGARFFAYQVSETEGYLGDGDQPLTEAELVAHWDAATR